MHPRLPTSKAALRVAGHLYNEDAMLSWMFDVCWLVFGAYCHEFCCDCECYVLVICQSKIKFRCRELYQNTKID